MKNPQFESIFVNLERTLVSTLKTKSIPLELL
jgi:hypothetical protein